MKTLKEILKSAYKSLKIITPSVILGASLLMPRSGKAQEFDFFIESGLTYEPSLVNKVKNIPLEVRDVPKHPDDTYASDSDVAPIKDDELGLYNRISLMSAKAGGKFSFLDDKFKIGLGVGLDFNIDATLSMGAGSERKDIRKRNYTNDVDTETRGYGAALTYYYIHPSFGPDWNTVLRPSLFSEIETKITEEIAVALGCELFKEKIVAGNGFLF